MTLTNYISALGLEAAGARETSRAFAANAPAIFAPALLFAGILISRKVYTIVCINMERRRGQLTTERLLPEAITRPLTF